MDVKNAELRKGIGILLLHYLYVNMSGIQFRALLFHHRRSIGFPAGCSCLSCEKQFPAPVSDLPPVIVHIGKVFIGKNNNHPTKYHL